MKHNKKLLVFFLVLTFIIYFYNKNSATDFTSYKNENVGSKNINNREVASVKNGMEMSKKEISNPTRNEEATSREVASSQSDSTDESSIDSLNQNDPILEKLKKYGMNPKNQTSMEGDKLFFSNKIVLIPLSEFTEDMGKKIGEAHNFVITEAANDQVLKNATPLTFSYATGSPVPLSGDLLVKYDDFKDLPYISETLSALGLKIIETASLHSVKRVIARPPHKNEVLQYYSQIQGLKKDGFEVLPDVVYQMKTR